MRKIILLLIFLLLCLNVFAYSNALKEPVFPQKEKYHEADYVNAYCNGQIEYELKDFTRVDCLTDEYAIEFDWGKKWAESIGQSLYYAKITGKKPAVAIIVKSPKDDFYIKRIKLVDKNIKIFRIKALDYQD